MTRATDVRSREAGLSLVEVLAAIAIIAVLTSAAVVYWTNGSSPARQAADRLALRLIEAREHALVTGETVGFAADFDGSGWRFFHFQDGAWRPIADHPALGAERLSPGVSLAVADGAIPRRDGDDAFEAPEVLFDPAGFDAPFEYEIRDREQTLVIRRDDAGAMQINVMGAGSERAA